MTLDKTEHVGDAKTLRTLVERTARALGCQAAGKIELRIAVDGAGKIVGVEVVSGDSDIGTALGHKLTGATSAAHATGQKKGTIAVTITIATR